MLKKLSPATVLAGAALFVSLGGVSSASRRFDQQPRDSERHRAESRRARRLPAGTGRRQRHASEPRRQRRRARGRRRRDRSLAGADVATNALGDREIAEPQLDINRLGGVAVGRYVKNLVRVETRTANDAVSPKGAPLARCPKGKHLVGGGARVVAPAPVPVALSVNGPSGRGWAALAYATAATGNWQLVSVAICG